MKPPDTPERKTAVYAARTAKREYGRHAKLCGWCTLAKGDLSRMCRRGADLASAFHAAQARIRQLDAQAEQQKGQGTLWPTHGE